uniref:Tc1-like transposase DDE domain-containing protein n=1 Tax=Salarias fasciatus TaxID=181472 RepID=A0A672HJ18_SALFA
HKHQEKQLKAIRLKNRKCTRQMKKKWEEAGVNVSFLGERRIQSMPWPANSPDLNPIENLWWKLKKMVRSKAPTCKDDLATAIKDSWPQIDEEYCLSLIKSSEPQRLQVVRKVKGGATKYW